MIGEKFKELTLQFKQELVLMGVSCLVIGISVVVMMYSKYTENVHNITVNKPSVKGVSTSGVIVVDIAGAIQSPDVYTMPVGSRLKELITLSGGLSEDADFPYVAKNINMASKLVDQQKIYIPFSVDDKIALSDRLNEDSSLMNINIATLNELDTLPGVGTVTAQKILDNRPFSSVEELLDKKILKKNVFEQVKTMVSIQ
jgi:competence protein ComEA